MPLQSLEGAPLHTRSLTVGLDRLADGRLHARGDVIDLRKNGFVPTNYDIQPAGIIHSMSIDMTLAPSDLTMEHIEVAQPFVAIEPSEDTGGECCRDPAPRLEAFAGDRLDAGFTKRLGAGFGGPLGCSHLLTLFQLMASTVPRAAALERSREHAEHTTPRPNERFFRRALFVDGALRSDEGIDVALQLTDTHSRPIAAGDAFSARLESIEEWKVGAHIERKRYAVEALEVARRRRTAAELGRIDWQNDDAAVAALVGAPLIPGMAGRVFGLFGTDEGRAPLRDALLQLAPGFIQIIAARMDDFFEARARAEAEGRGDAAPEVAALGGNRNACYMWREDSPVTRASSR